MSTCHECGFQLRESRGPGRTRDYRGGSGYVVPASLAYLECDHCGAEWMTDQQIHVLSAALEDQRLQRLQNVVWENAASSGMRLVRNEASTWSSSASTAA